MQELIKKKYIYILGLCGQKLKKIKVYEVIKIFQKYRLNKGSLHLEKKFKINMPFRKFKT